MAVNNPSRFVAGEKLHLLGVSLVLVEQELFRMRKVQKMGLTDKERLFLEKTEADVHEARMRLTKLRQRVLSTVKMDWDTWTPYE